MGYAVTEVKVDSVADHLPRLRKIVTCYARSIGMGKEEEMDAKLAITEAFANAVRHGSPNGSSSSILLRFSATDGNLIAEITDEGSGFDPGTLKPRDEHQPGGMGIPLMRALTDHVEFERNGRGMTVRLCKKVRRH